MDWFCMCWCSEEGVNYLLIHCKVAYPLWCFVSEECEDTLFGWRNWFGKYSSEIWNLDPLCLM